MRSMREKLKELQRDYLYVKLQCTHLNTELAGRIVDVGFDYVEIELLPNLDSSRQTRMTIGMGFILHALTSRGELPSFDEDCADLFKPKKEKKLKQSTVDELQLTGTPLDYD